MHCQLLIPGALTRNPGLIDKLAALQLPALQRLLAKGRADTQNWQGLDTWLLESFAVEQQQDWPSAPFALLGDDLAPGEHCWAHADPVSLRADRDRLVLADATQLGIRIDEAHAIAQSIAAHFGEALRLHVAAPGRWYARIAAPPQGETVALAGVVGRHLEAGRGAMGWHALMNELQMLLHEHPVNNAREERGEAPINGIWLWGAGNLAAANSTFASIATTKPLAMGLGRQAGINVRSLPANAVQWMDATAAPGVHVCVYEALQDAEKRGDAAQWLDSLVALERDWIAPCVGSLTDGHLGMLSIKLGDAQWLTSIEATRQDLRRFWRRKHPLAQTLAGSDVPEAKRSTG